MSFPRDVNREIKLSPNSFGLTGKLKILKTKRQKIVLIRKSVYDHLCEFKLINEYFWVFCERKNICFSMFHEKNCLENKK